MSQIVVLGVGNPLGGDDAVGPYVARMVQEKLGEKSVPHEVIAIDAGSAPESYTSVIRRNRPEQLILIDAADMGLPPGSVRLLSPDKIKTVSFSTHSMPLSALISYAGELCGQIYVIGIQPAQTEVGDRLSEPVQESGERVADLILEGRLNEIAPD